MPKNLRNIAVVSMSTVGSRILGLVRDILIFAALGTSIWNSAFILAFTLPNLFRRLLGEGALTSAVVPVFTDVLRNRGREAAFHFFNQILLRVSAILLATVTIGVALLAVLNAFGMFTGRWILGADLSVILLPYMIFICLAAIVSAGLNVIGRFAAAALTPVLLNLTMIGALALAWFQGSDVQETVYLLCGGVLLGGLLQLLLPAFDLIRQGWRPKLTTESSESLDEVWALFLPGLMGAAVLQVNILVSRLLAFTLDESSVATLYLASRLMELPLGVFTIAVVTVFFPLLASASSAKNNAGFAEAFMQGTRLILAITIPAGVGLVLLAQPILSVLFNWGSFTVDDVQTTFPLLVIYAAGLPFYSLATFATRGLHAKKDMHTPVKVAVFCLIINGALGFTLMQFFGAAGLALANVLTALIQSVLLSRGLSSKSEDLRFIGMGKPLLQITAGAIAMGFVVLLTAAACSMLLSIEEAKLIDGIIVALGVPAGALAFFAMLTLLRFKDIDELKSLLLRRKSALK